jgi:hypothetical protein
MRTIFIKVISLILLAAFSISPSSTSYAFENLGASLASDTSLNPERTKDVQNDIGHNLEPGAIGNGKPLLDLVAEIRPEKLKLQIATICKRQ